MNRSTHPVEQEEVMAYLDGELPADRAAGVAAHLDGCAECRALAAELRRISQQLTTWQVGPSPERLNGEVSVALRERRSNREQELPGNGLRRRHPLVRGWILGLAGAFAVVLLLVWWGAETKTFWYAKEAVPPAANRQQTVAGHVVDLPNANTKVSTGQGLAGAALGRAGTVGKLTAPPSPGDGPMIARTASLTIVAKDFEAARAAVERIVSQHQGYIAELTTNSPKEAARTLAATLRIPAPRLNAALAELKALGRVEEETQAGEEVTKQYTDLVARLKNSRATEQRLVDILRQRPGKVSEVLEVEQEIARVRGEIEQMEADRRSLETRVQFATVKLQVNEEYKAQLQVTPPSTRTRLRNALVGGYRDAADSLIGFVLFLLGAGPTLLLWSAVLYWPARFAWRRWRAAHLTHQASALG